MIIDSYVERIPDRHLMVVLFLITLSCTLLSEGVTYVLSYRNREIKKLDKELRDTKVKLEKEIAKGNASKTAEIEKFTELFRKKTGQLSSKMLLANLAPIPIMIFYGTFVLKKFQNRRIGELPFEPINLLKRFIQKGIENPSPREISVTFWFFFCIAFNRTLTRHFIPKIYQPGLHELSMLTGGKSKTR